jgi:hypothetical protein
MRSSCGARHRIFRCYKSSANACNARPSRSPSRRQRQFVVRRSESVRSESVLSNSGSAPPQDVPPTSGEHSRVPRARASPPTGNAPATTITPGGVWFQGTCGRPLQAFLVVRELLPQLMTELAVTKRARPRSCALDARPSTSSTAETRPARPIRRIGGDTCSRRGERARHRCRLPNIPSPGR